MCERTSMCLYVRSSDYLGMVEAGANRIAHYFTAPMQYASHPEWLHGAARRSVDSIAHSPDEDAVDHAQCSHHNLRFRAASPLLYLSASCEVLSLLVLDLPVQMNGPSLWALSFTHTNGTISNKLHWHFYGFLDNWSQPTKLSYSCLLNIWNSVFSLFIC